MYGIYANIWGILMVNVTIYTIHGSYGVVSWNRGTPKSSISRWDFPSKKTSFQWGTRIGGSPHIMEDFDAYVHKWDNKNVYVGELSVHIYS